MDRPLVSVMQAMRQRRNAAQMVARSAPRHPMRAWLDQSSRRIDRKGIGGPESRRSTLYPFDLNL